MMAYLAVLSGARGVWWYALRSPGYDLTKADLWGQFARLNEEIAALGAAAVGGADVTLQSDNPKLYAAAWRAGDKVKLAVANPQAEPQTATVKAEAALAAAETTRGSGTFEVKDGALQVTLQPGEAALVTATAAK